MTGGILRQALRGLLALSATAGVVGASPVIAHAMVNGSASVDLPSSVTVGQTGVPAAINVTNLNDGAEADVSNTVCTADGSPSCGSQGIAFLPSCKAFEGKGPRCPPSSGELGALRVSATAAGRLGTACAGMAFTTSVVDPLIGLLQFTPQPAGARVILPRAGSACSIDFALDVLKLPVVDANPGDPGVQTLTRGSVSWYGNLPSAPDDAYRVTGGGAGRSGTLTVARAAPALALSASGSGQAGDRLVAGAAVSGRAYPQPGATVDFKLFAPDEATCSGPSVFTSSVDYPVAGGQVSSAPFTAAQPGTYHWTASYSGDASNAPAGTGCTAAGKAVPAGDPQPHGPNGQPASREARLTVRFRTGGKATRRVHFRSAPTLDGTLQAEGGHPIGGAQITVSTRRRQSGAGTMPAAPATTRADGSFTYRLAPGPSRTVTFAYTAFEGDASPAVSAKVSTLVRAVLTARLSPRSPRADRPLRVTGRLRYLPRAGVQILLQAADGRVWRPIGATKTEAGGRFALRYRFSPKAARRTFALRAMADSPIYPFAVGYSSAIRVHVRP